MPNTVNAEERPVILILNGPNLNMLGMREPSIYGADTLGDIEAACGERAEALGLAIDFRQSNYEGELIDWVHETAAQHDGIVINAGGLSHTSISLMDALRMCDLPIIEVHLSNIYAREPFRHHSYISQVAGGVICGLGAQGYLLALEAMAKLIDA
ncbi:MAG: type II 3-dehydroquinate dehydratase [Rhodospirillaceae bacterium]|nr:type II 3-dehydroquinate dehydratase [Rhodospirillaceae bacterium]